MMRKNWPMKRFLTVIMSKVNADDKKDLLPSSQCNDNNDDFSNNVQPSSSHNVGKDFHNILFLMFLYLLQGKSKSLKLKIIWLFIYIYLF